MRKIALVVILILVIGALYSEVGKKISNIESFFNRSGALFEKDFINIGTFRKIKIQVLVVTDLISNNVQKALRLQMKTTSGYSSMSKTVISVLDPDEVTSLITSLKIIKDKILQERKQNYTEVTFKSRSGFEAGCYYHKDKWKLYMQLDEYDSDSFVSFSNSEIGNFISILEQAQTKMGQ